MTEPALLPDVEEVFTQWLTAQSALSGVIVCTSLPITYDGSQRVVRLDRIGGAADYLMRIDRPRLDVDCWGPSKAAASDLTALVRRLLLVDLIQGANLSQWSCSISDVREDVGPQYLDEPDYPPAGRYLMQITAVVHSA
ncbi:hypothetical protein E6W39_18955 [Kitasatospora acidiphila]|uniref:Tail terminator n=1 Tax=Kitasatospora acidiphila TaxID=2567942 RepID=A0A540W4H3_9ACTN|nr:hypothetical protein [Kitasatospora acidiphila]TQF03931.1 hypothetical protein E6W39_18955 [Kitasatospora acidiphila]